jgi:hypothetical protein
MMKVRMGLRRRRLLGAQAGSLPAEHRALGSHAHREAAQGVRVLPSAVGAERGADLCTASDEVLAGMPVRQCLTLALLYASQRAGAQR